MHSDQEQEFYSNEGYTIYPNNGGYSIVNRAAQIWLTFTIDGIDQTIVFGNTHYDEVVIQSYPEFISYAEQVIGNHALDLLIQHGNILHDIFQQYVVNLIPEGEEVFSDEEELIMPTSGGENNGSLSANEPLTNMRYIESHQSDII